MKRFLIFSFLFAVFTISYSQDLVIRNFVVDEMNLSGSTYPRKDMNDDFCSLIIVQSNLKDCDMNFLGNVVGNIEERNGDYWVYVTPGTKKLKIKCPNYITADLDISDFGVGKTAPKKTYILTVVGQNSITPTTETKMQGLIIKYTPSNAVVKINNEDMEASNGLFKTKYPIGKYTYEISAPGYVSKSEILELSSKEPINISVTLQTLTQIQETQLQEAESLYKKGITQLHLGQDENAEKLAVNCIELGSDKGYEIITALQLLGYYDDGIALPVKEELLNQWQMKRYHVYGKELIEKRLTNIRK